MGLPPADRAALLDARCGDDAELRDDVETLLRHDAEARSWIDAAVGTVLESIAPAGASFFSPGQVVAGRYRIVRFLAEGGMGQVYEADDQELNRRIALKTVHAELADDSDAMQRFKREIALATRISHPNVCRVYDLGRHSVAGQDGERKITFLTMELLLGETLQDRLTHRPSDDGSLGRRPRAGGRSPRPQARQRDANPRPARPPRRGHRLRHGEDASPRRRPGEECDEDRERHRYPGLHGSRAGAGAGTLARQRHLRFGRRDVRDGDRRAAAQGRELAVGPREADDRTAAVAPDCGSRPIPLVGEDDPPLSVARANGPLPRRKGRGGGAVLGSRGEGRSAEQRLDGGPPRRRGSQGPSRRLAGSPGGAKGPTRGRCGDPGAWPSPWRRLSASAARRTSHRWPSFRS